MESLYLLIPISVVLVFAIAVVFWMSVRGGQFDDLEGPGFKVLMDDDRPKQNNGEASGEVLETDAKAGEKLPPG